MSFIAGAQSEHEQLTRWCDPKVELPEYRKRVLVKFKDGMYDCLFREKHLYLGDGWSYGGGGILVEDENPVIGWREIHE